MTQPAYDCLSAGIIVADHVCAPIEHVPAPGELVLTERMDLTVGGCAANVALDLARLGMRSAVLGCVGNDVFGRSIAESLAGAGVDCAHLRRSSTRETSGTLVINARGADRRFIHSIGANAEFTAEGVSDELIRSARVLYLGGYCLFDTLTPDNVAALFRRARQAGVITVLDVVIPDEAAYWPRLEPVLPWVDLFLPNEDEARRITGHADPVAQAEAFQRAGAKTVAITCGQAGAVLLAKNLQLRVGPYPVQFQDGTGSGDAFTAGYLYGLLHDRDLETCLRFGSALGASCVRAAGATAGVFNAQELADFVASQPLVIERI
jgi:sugar/nucleoside kinase (ribokinase family)